MCLDFHDYPRNENRGEKVKSTKKFNAADDRQLATDKARPISTEFSTSFANALWVKERIFPTLNQIQAISYLGASLRVVHAK